MLPLEYSSNFWKTYEISLINCEINFAPTWYTNSFIIDDPVNNQAPTFAITDTKLYVPVVTLSTLKNNSKLLHQVLKQLLTGININHKEQCRNKTDT